MSFILGMLGPICIADFRDFLHPGVWRDDLPKGLGGTPVNILSRELLKRGQRLIIFTLDPTVQDEIVLDGENLRICIGHFRPTKRARDFFSAERKYLLRAIRREQPDILHAHWTYEWALAAQASGLPHVITAHDAPINILRHNLIPYRFVRTLMAYRVLSRAKRVISVSPYVAKHLRRFVLYRGKDEVIPNGLPEQMFKRAVSARNSTLSVTYATILNGWGGLKNGQVAIKSFAQIHQNRPKDRLIMFGAGHGTGEAAEHWARERGVADGIVFVGQLSYEQLIDRLAQEVDVLVHSSLEESHGMVLIEAMALGIPVIGGDASGAVPWTLDNGRTGILVDVTSATELASAMVRLANAPEERMAFSKSAKDSVRQRFHIQTVADAYECVYKDLRGYN